MALFNFSNFRHLWQNVRVQQEVAYGWEPDPYDERDEKHEFNTTKAARISIAGISFIDNTSYYKAVSSQWHMPACTANAGADYLEAVDIYDRAKSGIDVEEARVAQPDYSRMFLWWNGRNEMDPPRNNDDKAGCYNRLIMDVAARFGVCPEAYWPYDEQRIPPLYRTRPCTRPSLTAFRRARSHTIEAYHALQGSGDVRLEQIVKALTVNPGVFFGTALGSEFGTVGSNVLHPPKTNADIIARHAMVIVGYDRAKAAFLVRNSHGTSFGIREPQYRGHLWMHESYIAWSKTRSLWVCTKGAM